MMEIGTEISGGGDDDFSMIDDFAPFPFFPSFFNLSFLSAPILFPRRDEAG